MKKMASAVLLLILAGCLATRSDLLSTRQAIESQAAGVYASKEEVAKTYVTKAEENRNRGEMENRLKRKLQEEATAPVKKVQSDLDALKVDVARIDQEQKLTAKRLSDLELATDRSRKVMMQLVGSARQKAEEDTIGRLRYVTTARFKPGSAELTPAIMYELNGFIHSSEGRKFMISRIFGFCDKDSIQRRGWEDAEELGYKRAQAVCKYISKHVFVRPYHPHTGSPFLSAARPEKQSDHNRYYGKVMILGERAP